MNAKSIDRSSPLWPLTSEARIEKFKEKIAYEAKISSEDEAFVEYSPRDIQLSGPLSEWTILSTRIIPGPPSDYIDIKISNGERKTSILILVFPPQKINSAREEFLEKANSTTMQEIFYVPAKFSAGSISLVNKNEKPTSGLFIFHNVVMDIYSEDEESLEAAAKFMHTEFKNRLVKNNQKPQPAGNSNPSTNQKNQNK